MPLLLFCYARVCVAHKFSRVFSTTMAMNTRFEANAMKSKEAGEREREARKKCFTKCAKSQETEKPIISEL